MNVRLSIPLLVAIALASCAENIPDPHGPKTVLFSAVASHSTKGIITTTSYPVNVPFVVEAVHYPDGKKDPAPASFMQRQTVSFDSANGVWKPEEDYFWPESGQMRFYAGSPDVPEVTMSIDHGIEADWSIDTREDTTVDLCFAEVKEKCVSHSVAVPLVFNHALTQVCFKARPIKFYSSAQKEHKFIQANIVKVLLDSVRIRGLVSAGHFTQEPRNWTYDDPVKTADYMVFTSKEGLELKTDRYDNPILTTVGTLLLMPQVIPQDAMFDEWHRVVVRTSITDTSSGKIISDETYPIECFSSIPLADYCTKWVMDYKYTFRLGVGLNESKLDSEPYGYSELTATVTDWTETREIILGDE